MSKQINEKGFILATSLVLLLLMGMMTAAVMVSVNASQRSSASAEDSTEAFYYAETAVNYVDWALLNNADFDGYTYPNVVRDDIVDTDPCVVAGVAARCAYKFGEPDARGYDPYTAHPVFGEIFDPYGNFHTDPYVYLPNPEASGDYAEWRANRFNPSGNNLVLIDDTVDPYVYVQNTAGDDVYGQLMYYDNSPLANRIVSYQTDDLYTNGASGEPTMYGIYRHLPRYIMLSIDDAGNITPSMPPVNAVSPWHGTDTGDLKDDIEADKDIHYPTNGALVWLTGGNRTDDLEIDPMDTFFAPAYNNRVAPSMWDPYTAYTGVDRLECDISTMLNASVACSVSGEWVDDADYGLVIYAIGYVRGKAQRLVRVVYKR